MASMNQTGYAAQSLGMNGPFATTGDQIVNQLQTQLEEQRKRRRTGANPTDRMGQFLTPAARDLASTGTFNDLLGAY